MDCRLGWLALVVVVVVVVVLKRMLAEVWDMVVLEGFGVFVAVLLEGVGGATELGQESGAVHREQCWARSSRMSSCACRASWRTVEEELCRAMLRWDVM